jgi:hypothetical protein
LAYLGFPCKFKKETQSKGLQVVSTSLVLQQQFFLLSWVSHANLRKKLNQKDLQVVVVLHY